MHTKEKFHTLAIRVPNLVNDWLESKSDETGLSKNALVYIALDNYINAKEALNVIGDVLKKLDSPDYKLNNP